MNGRTFVLVPEAEYERLLSRRARSAAGAKSQLPPLPRPNADGTYPAVAAARATIARTIVSRREAAGLTQKALASAAHVRPETLNRIEKAKVTPDTATIAKIHRALSAAERQ